MKTQQQKFEFDSFKICHRSMISQMIIRYKLSSFSVNASSISSVKLVIILRELKRDGFKNLDCYFAITGTFYFFSFKPILE